MTTDLTLTEHSVSMTADDLFDDPADTRQEIMKATFEALCEHGYANLTIDRIAGRFPKSKSLVYHHYDGKDELLLDFLEFMLEDFESDVPGREYDDAAAHLRAVLDHTLPDELDDERAAFTTALVELRAQAAHDPAYDEHFTTSTRFFHEQLAAIVERGIEEGVFRDVDPDRVAALLLTAIDGAMFQRVTADVEETIPDVRDELRTYVETRLLADPEPAR